MRHVTDEGLALIKRFESFGPEIYVCSGGWLTIGCGHLVRDEERESFADGIDEAKEHPSRERRPRPWRTSEGQ